MISGNAQAMVNALADPRPRTGNQRRAAQEASGGARMPATT
jgi:hypothetical protein